MPGSEETNLTIKILTEDIQAHRDYIHRLYRSAFVAGAVLVTAGVGLGYWVLGKQLDARVFEYRIVESLRDRAKDISTQIIDGAKIAAQKEVDTYIKEKIGAEVEQQIEPKLQALSAESLPELFERFAFPYGTVIAMDRQECPQGWAQWEAGAGRTIIGAGQGQGLSERKLRQLGGSEVHTLSLGELPAHTHSTIQMIGDNNVDGVDSTTVRSGDHHNESRQTGAAGGGKSHNNMQPFVVLNFCIKQS